MVRVLFFDDNDDDKNRSLDVSYDDDDNKSDSRARATDRSKDRYMQSGPLSCLYSSIVTCV